MDFLYPADVSPNLVSVSFTPIHLGIFGRELKGFGESIERVRVKTRGQRKEGRDIGAKERERREGRGGQARGSKESSRTT